MASFNFVHAADLHLDCPFSGIGARSEAISEVLYRSTFAAFENLVELCIRKKAAFLLLAGDLFEYEDKSLRALVRFKAGVTKLAKNGIPVLAVTGNHDPLTGAAISAPGLLVFPADEPGEKIIEKDGQAIARVRGVSYARKEESRNLAALFPGKPDHLFTAGLVHANAGGAADHADYAPCTISDLDARCDYWALGHVHEKKVLSEHPHAVYPGNSQARSVRETGPRGCFVVEVEENRVRRAEFRPVDALRWENLSVDVSEIKSAEDAVEEAAEAVLSALKAADGRPLCCRVALTGRTPAFRELSRPGADEDIRAAIADRLEGLEPFAWVSDLRIAAAPALDMEALSSESGLAGSLFSIADELKGSFGEEGELPPLLEEALAELFRDRRMPRELAGFSRDEALAVLSQAKLLCAELLSEDEA